MNNSISSNNPVSILLYSLQRICRNLSQLLNALDADVDTFERLLTEITTTLHRIPTSSASSSSSSTNEETEHNLYIENNEDFYEKICDEQLEPRPARVTTL